MLAMGLDQLDRLLGVDALLIDLERMVVHQRARGDAAFADLGKLVPKAVLVISDWREVGLMVDRNRGKLIPLARIHRLDGSAPEIRASSKASGDAVVVLRVEIAPIMIEFMRAVLHMGQ